MLNTNKNLNDDLELNIDLNDDELLKDGINKGADKDNDGKISSQSNNQSDNKDNGVVALPKAKVILIKKILRTIKENNERVLELLSDSLAPEDEAGISIGQLSDETFTAEKETVSDSKIIEGVFDGENMIGPDGKQYNVPANYASKSKLVEGDILKLTITANGTFIYKQIGPIERARIIGKLDKSSSGEYSAIADSKRWKLLTASVTYYKGEPGDEVVILIPKACESKWAAVENIVRKLE